MTVTDRYVIREMNEKLVLNTIIQKEPISRADISKQTNLNKATVSSIVNDLLTKNLTLELGTGKSSGGRKPILVTFNHRAGISLSIDLGPDYLSLLFTYLNGEILSERCIPFTEAGKDNVSQLIKKTVEVLLPKLPETPYGIVGICIAIHGIVHENKLIFSPFYNFESDQIKQDLEDYYKVPVHFENEANLSALGEQRHTSPSPNLISLNIKYGIGAGIILNGSLFTGVHGRAGEVGHLIAIPGGKPCPCGNHGCLEQYASEFQLLKNYTESQDGQHQSFNHFKRDYLAGNPVALNAMEQFTQFIAIGINNLCSSFNPEVIIINCRITNQIEGVIEKIREKLSSQLTRGIILKSSSLQEKSTLLGGAYVNTREFLGFPH